MTSETPPAPLIQEFVLEEDNELRFEVGREDVSLELIKGKAEIFGSELEQHKKYIFVPGSRIALFTWKSAVVELVGPTTSAYVSNETPMIIYLNTHAALEQLRKKAGVSEDANQSGRGPRIMLVGPTDVGKSTVCRILCNYAIRQGRSPIYVDLDVGQNSITVPGSIGAIYLSRTADVIDGFHKELPIALNFGSLSPGDNIPLYESLVKELAEIVTEKGRTIPEAGVGGVIINTCGWVNGEGYGCIVSAAEQFEVDVVAVLDHERLFNDLQKQLPSFVKVVHLPKSGGVENRSRDMRVKSRNCAIQKYFYGTSTEPCFPFTFDVPFDEIQIVKIGTEKLPESCLPVGMKMEDHHTKVVPISITSQSALQHFVLAVTPCKTVSQLVVTTPIIGYVVITAINHQESTVTILSPQSELPNKMLVLSKLQFVDDHNIKM